MERRAFLKYASLALGSTLSASVVDAVLALDAGATVNLSKPILGGSQRALLDRLVDLIIPETDTPGARQAGVTDFIEFMLSRGPEEELNYFLAGLADLDHRSRKQFKVGFSKLQDSQQVALLSDLETAVRLSEEEIDTDTQDLHQASSTPRPFIQQLKEYTVVGYFTSEAGTTQALHYKPVPGYYDPCLPLTAEDRAWFFDR